MEEIDDMLILTNQLHFLITYYLGCTQGECKPDEIAIKDYREKFESRISAGATEKLPGEKPHAKTVAWSYDMEGRAQKMR